MAGGKKKGQKGNDLISERDSALSSQIAALEAEIKKIDSQLQNVSKPKLRSTAMPHGGTVSRAPEKSAPAPAPKPVAHEPIFEEIKTVQPTDENAPDLYNELGVRKYDLPALWQRLKHFFNGPTTTNPRLVNYLAAGGVHGLRPLRYEKRVARNRFILFTAVLFLLLLGIILFFAKLH
ncbi:MAG TPA: hypothetical protein VFV81_10625 [Verrucomicrobiae bacterium]|nr:hypothetical protein [Verrucomicrobiae bacterium]